MPIYEYECTGCGDRSEILQRMGDPAPAACDKCGKPVKRLLSAPSFQFKGTGWYVTDYGDKRKKGERKAEKSKESSDSTSEAKTGGDKSSPSSTGKSAPSSDKASKSGDKPSSSSSG